MFFWSRLRGYFSNRARNIYTFREGDKQRRVDPVVIGNRLKNECPEYLDLLTTLARKIIDAPVGPVRSDLLRQKEEAAIKLAEVAMKVFDLKPLDDTTGVTGAEAVDVLTGYFLFMEELAREASPFGSSPATA